MATQSHACGDFLIPRRTDPNELHHYHHYRQHQELDPRWSGTTQCWRAQAEPALPHDPATRFQPPPPRHLYTSSSSVDESLSKSNEGLPNGTGTLHHMSDESQKEEALPQGTGLKAHASSQGSEQPLIFCWQHGCNGRSFTNRSNYLRHCREKSRAYAKPKCPRCGQEFLRDSGRDLHVGRQLCKAVGVDLNGVLVWSPWGSQDEGVCLLLGPGQHGQVPAYGGPDNIGL